MIESYPSVLKRYLSSFIDYCFLMGFYMFCLSFFPGNDKTISLVRFLVPVIVVCIYEPFLTSKFCTVGQLVTGIRIRNDDKTYKKLPIYKSYIRCFVKLMLGSLSFFSILFSKKSKAIHDYAVGSIVIDRKKLAAVYNINFS